MKSWPKYIAFLILGILLTIGFIFAVNYYSRISNNYAIGYRDGALNVINYTASTGNILYFYNGSIQEISIVDQCNAMIKQQEASE
jgi:hypothetical protein